MKSLFYVFFACAVSVLTAQIEKEELPEPSEPPFEEGALPLEGGYTIKREGAKNLNFRIVENKIRLYWLDKDGLIAKPEVASAVVRFAGSVRGRAYHKLAPLSNDTGLGSAGSMIPPHLYNVTLVIPVDGKDEPETYSFRYTPAMSKAATPSQ